MIDELEAREEELESRIAELEEKNVRLKYNTTIKTDIVVEHKKQQEIITKLREALEFYADPSYYGDKDLCETAVEALKECFGEKDE